jgi:hypothetical protein
LSFKGQPAFIRRRIVPLKDNQHLSVVASEVRRMDSKPWLVSLNGAVVATEKERVDWRAERIVTQAYSQACKERALAPRAFELALDAYQRHFPAIPQHIAGHAVADILARHEG